MWGDKLPPKSLVLMVYMATRSLDSDEMPWFSRGHKHLAEHAFRRPSPAQRADVKAVERAMSPILRLGAAVADRRAAIRNDGPSTARYRLSLGSVEYRARIARDVPHFPGDVNDEDPPRPPETVPDVPHFSDSRPPENGHTPPENRGTEDKGGGSKEERGPTSSPLPVDPPPNRQEEERLRQAKTITEGRFGLSSVERARLTGLITATLAAGWTADAVRAELDKPLAGASSVYAVLHARLRGLGQPPPPKAAPPPRCGQCNTHRQIETTDDHGRIRMDRCPRCHPLRRQSTVSEAAA